MPEDAEDVSNVPPQEQQNGTRKLPTEESLLLFKYSKTAIFYLLFIGMGSIVSIPGPTLLDLAHIVNVGLEKIGIIFTFRSLGFLVGAFLAGILLDYFSKKVPILIVFAVCMASFTLAMPFSRNLSQLKIFIFLSGVSTGGLNNGVNVCLLNIWGRKADSYYLALHFSFAVGALIGPLIAGPFLEVPQDGPGNHTISHEEQGTPSITWAYVTIITFAFFITCILTGFSLLTSKYTQRVETSEDEEEEVTHRESGRGFVAGVLVVAAAATFCTTAIETSFAAMTLAYAVEGRMHLHKLRASYLTSVYWAAYMVTRFISIFLATRFRSEYLIAFDVITLVLSGVVLSTLGRLFEPALWVGTALVGVGIATLFPSTVSWVGRYVHITFKVGSLFFIMGSLSEMIWPVVLGLYLKTLPDLLYFFVLAVAVSCSILYFFLSIVFSHQSERSSPEESEALSMRHYPSVVSGYTAKSGNPVQQTELPTDE